MLGNARPGPEPVPESSPVMTAYKVVVDGSNVATEGRSLPSLGQLDEAVRAFIDEHPQADVLVIVDTTFAHRISAPEQPLFEAAYAAGEIICPPAGTIGRGDSFILKVADKLGATIFSNDSFQEFHGTYNWLFEKGRLVGGKPVPGLGWVFMDRTPVRGPKSREAVRDAKRTQARFGSREASLPMPVPKAPPPFVISKSSGEATQAAIAAALAEPDVTLSIGEPRKGKKKKGRDKRNDRDGAPRVERTEAEKEQRRAEKEARHDAERAARADREGAAEGEEANGRRKRRRKKGAGGEGSIEPTNESLVFITFIAEHTIGSEIAGVVDSYSSHGFYVLAAGARCYVPLLGLAETMPRSAKEVVQRGEEHQWIVRSFDPPRRGIELALVGTPGALAKGAEEEVAAAAISAVVDPTDTGSAAPSKAKGSRSRSAGTKATAPRSPVRDVAVAPERELAAVAPIALAPAVTPRRSSRAQPAGQELPTKKTFARKATSSIKPGVAAAKARAGGAKAVSAVAKSGSAPIKAESAPVKAVSAPLKAAPRKVSTSATFAPPATDKPAVAEVRKAPRKAAVTTTKASVAAQLVATPIPSVTLTPVAQKAARKTPVTPIKAAVTRKPVASLKPTRAQPDAAANPPKSAAPGADAALARVVGVAKKAASPRTVVAPKAPAAAKRVASSRATTQTKGAATKKAATGSRVATPVAKRGVTSKPLAPALKAAAPRSSSASKVNATSKSLATTKKPAGAKRRS